VPAPSPVPAPVPVSAAAPAPVPVPVPAPAPAPVRALTVRYFAGARAAVGGLSSESAEAATLEELTQVLADRHGERLALVMKAASFLVDGLTCHDRDAPLPADATIDVLPPFAGG
jgi:molybdopterin synthase sulfur carrier subunit